MAERGVDVLTWLILQLSLLSCKCPSIHVYYLKPGSIVGI